MDAGAIALEDAADTYDAMQPRQMVVMDAGVSVDAVAPGATVGVSGTLVELGSYVAGQAPDPVGAASLLALGVVPAVSALTSNDPGIVGAYSMALPQNGTTLVFASRAGYFYSYTELKTTSSNTNGKLLFIAKADYINALATAYGVDLAHSFACHGPPLGSASPADQCIYAIVIGRILDGGGHLVAGVTPTEVKLTGGETNGPWFANGPYMLTATGTASQPASASMVRLDPITRSYVGGLFIAFAEIPATDGPQNLTLRVSIHHQDGQGVRYFGPHDVSAFRPYGVSWIEVAETGTPPQSSPHNVDFDSQVYPLFLPVTQGGLGCQGCHTNEGGSMPSGEMNLFGGPDVAYQSLEPMMHMDRVNVQNPPQSLVLKNPLYGSGQDHPIVAFASVQDPAYKTILAWIQEGAVRRMTSAPQVSFSAQVVPLLANTSTAGGMGCNSCHANPGPDGNFLISTDPAQLYAALTQEMAQYQTGCPGPSCEPHRIDETLGNADRSLLLMMPLMGNDLPHPVKFFSSTADPRYTTLYRWIADGFPMN
jgi:hypothetical protein